MSLDQLNQLKQKTEHELETQPTIKPLSSNQIPNYSQPTSEPFLKDQTIQATVSQTTLPNPKATDQTKPTIRSNKKPKSSSKFSKLPKFLLPAIIGIVVLIGLIVAGVLIYPKIFPVNPFASDKDLFRGKLTKLDKDLDLIIKPEQKEGIDCSSNPKIQEEKGISNCEEPLTFQYYTAGIFNKGNEKGKYKDYTRILALEPKTGLMSIFATKDYTKFVFHGDPTLKDKSADDDTYIYKVIKKDKIEDIDILPQEFNRFLEVNDEFVLSSIVIDKGIFCPLNADDGEESKGSCDLIADTKKIKEIGQTKNGLYKVYTAAEGNGDRYYVYDQIGILYTAFINQKSIINKYFFQDDEGKKIAQIIENRTKEEEAKKTEASQIGSIIEKEIKKEFPSYSDRSTICPYYLSFAATMVETKQPILPNYNYNPESCELINLSPNTYSSKLKLVDIKEADLEVIGQLKDTKTNVYKYKSETHPNLIEFKDSAETEGLNIEELMKKNPLLLIQDPFGRFFQLQGSVGETATPPQETPPPVESNSSEK
jgi:hypothetical protein